MGADKKFRAAYNSDSQRTFYRKRKAMEQATRMEDGSAVKTLTSYGFVIQSREQSQTKDDLLPPTENKIAPIEKAVVELTKLLTPQRKSLVRSRSATNNVDNMLCFTIFQGC
jgi:hypothetical protein